MNISKGSLVRIKCDMKTVNLYHLQGTIISGNATIASNKSFDSVTTNLLYMRLGK